MSDDFEWHPRGTADKLARYEEALREVEFDKAHLLCAMNSIARSACCEGCNEAKRVAIKCIEDLHTLNAEALKE